MVATELFPNHDIVIGISSEDGVGSPYNLKSR